LRRREIDKTEGQVQEEKKKSDDLSIRHGIPIAIAPQVN
jgi:hypothetical protein